MKQKITKYQQKFYDELKTNSNRHRIMLKGKPLRPISPLALFIHRVLNHETNTI